MHPTETRALWRAVLLLALVSGGRWAWSARPGALPVDEESVLPELLATSRAAATEAERRREALAEGETVDPNRASDVELDRLPGVGPATARAIVAARESGVLFRRPEDLLAVRGVGEATLRRIRPALDLSAPPPVRLAAPGGARGAPLPERLDVNHAGVDELESLPGIGPALARRIVAAREEQMFMSVEDLGRVRGIGEATVERLRAHVSVGTARGAPGR